MTTVVAWKAEPASGVLPDIPVRPVLPLYAAGQREWCHCCGRKLGVTRSPGLVACKGCWLRHERAGIWPSAARPHDPSECRLCSPTATPDSHPELEAWLAAVTAPAEDAADRVTLREHCDGLVATEQAARDEAVRWRVTAGRARQAVTEVRPLVLIAAALAAYATARASSRGRPSAIGAVAALVAMNGRFESGRACRPGRADTAALLAITEQAVTGLWRQLEQLGWMTRTHQGGAASLRTRITCGTTRVRAEFAVTATPTRFLSADLQERQGLMDRAQSLLEALAGRAETLATRADARAAQALAMLAMFDRRRAELRRAVASVLDSPTAIFLPPPGGVQVSECVAPVGGFRTSAPILINRSVLDQARPTGRKGAPRPAPTREGPRSPRVQRPRTVRKMCPVALALARELRECTELRLKLGRAHMAMLAALVGRLARAGWTVSDVVLQVQEATAALVAASGGRYTPPAVPDNPVAWLARRLEGADPARPPAAARLARKIAEADRLRAEQDAVRTEAARVAAERADPARSTGAAAARAVAAQAGRFGATLRTVGGAREAAVRSATVEAVRGRVVR